MGYREGQRQWAIGYRRMGEAIGVKLEAMGYREGNRRKNKHYLVPIAPRP